MQIPKRIYDLSQPIYHNCPGWPTFDQTTVNWDYRIVSHGFNAETLSLNMHTGTHLDAPYHFFQNGKTIDQLPLEVFAGPCAVLDLRQSVKPDAAITPEDLAPHMAQIEKGDIVILCTGYGQKRGYSREYQAEYPYLGGPAATILAQAGVKGVGTDALSMGGMGSDAKARPCHEELLSLDIFIIEELCIPESLLDGKKRYIAAFPLFMKGCGGAPARAVMFEF